MRYTLTKQYRQRIKILDYIVKEGNKVYDNYLNGIISPIEYKERYFALRYSYQPYTDKWINPQTTFGECRNTNAL